MQPRCLSGTGAGCSFWPSVQPHSARKPAHSQVRNSLTSNQTTDLALAAVPCSLSCSSAAVQVDPLQAAEPC